MANATKITITVNGVTTTYNLKDDVSGYTTLANVQNALKYAASSTPGGSATSAVKLDTSTAGSSTQPCYFANGKPSACTYSLNKTVPSDAKFTDTTYSLATASANGLMPSYEYLSSSDITELSNMLDSF